MPDAVRRSTRERIAGCGGDAARGEMTGAKRIRWREGDPSTLGTTLATSRSRHPFTEERDRFPRADGDRCDCAFA